MDNRVRQRTLKVLNREDVREFIVSISGDEGYIVFSYLLKRRNEIDEFTLSEKLDIQINKLRSILYKLYDKKLVSFTRRRDRKKGWYLYSWSAVPSQLLFLMRKKYEKRIKHFKKLLQGDYYYCEKCDKIYTLEEAARSMFLCPICGEPLIPSREIKSKIEVKIKKLERKLKAFQVSPARIRTGVKRSRASHP